MGTTGDHLLRKDLEDDISRLKTSNNAPCAKCGMLTLLRCEQARMGSNGHDSGSLSIGKLIKSTGYPAIIIAIFIGFGYYNRLLTVDLKQKVDENLQTLALQSRALAQTLIIELHKAKNP